jgi:hypothetical protein
MKTKNIIICVIAVLIIVSGYFVWEHQQISSDAVYTNTKYGYAISINKNFKYTEFNEADGSGTGLMITDPSATSPYSQLSINVITPPAGGTTLGTATTLNGLPATVLTGKSGGSQGDATVKTYEVVHKSMVYEINIIPADETDFQALANTFRFTN